MTKKTKNFDPKAVAAKQAANIVKPLQGKDKVIKSVGSVRNFEERLTQIALYANQYLEKSLRDMTPKDAHQYLSDHCAIHAQKTLDMDRQAMQHMLQHTKKLHQDKTLEVIKSEKSTVENSRSYTKEQVSIITNAQNAKNSLSTEIAYATGLRAHELFTLQRIDERQADPRPAREEKFDGRDGERYTVKGKGGLVREIQLPSSLASRLEEHRLTTPRIVTDRGIRYHSLYDVAGGKNWANSFSAASKRHLNWTTGAHGLRHSYAQERMDELTFTNHYGDALEIVSQEMGHFRPDITEVYLR